MSQAQEVVINFKGGIVSPGYLRYVLDAASTARVSHASFGLRQQLMMQVPAHNFKDFEKICLDKNIAFHKAGEAKPNIVSSYGAANTFSYESWLSEGVYKDVFDMFNFEPTLKINICDSNQSLTPFFTGNLNWISSGHSHFWYLYIRFPRSSKLYCWPQLIYTNDIAKVSAMIQQVMKENHAQYYGNENVNLNSLFRTVAQMTTSISRPVADQLALPLFHLPYYEGFNKEGENWWLGIYRRDELFPIEFLKDVCSICLETKIGEFYTTTWKSIIIKGIKTANKNLWDRVLGKYRINVRHAANELNWQVEDQNEDGLIIKRHVIRHFDKEDVRTYGLSFAVKTRPSSSMFGSVIISRQQPGNNSRLKALDRFDILYTRDFNPNSTDLVMYRKGVQKDQIGTYLVSLCKYYYEQGTGLGILPAHQNTPGDPPTDSSQLKLVFQCCHCLSVYDPASGDPGNNIPPQTPFNELSEMYTCPLCDAAKEDFIEVDFNLQISKLGN